MPGHSPTGALPALFRFFVPRRRRRAIVRPCSIRAGGRAPKHAELNLHGASLHFRLEPAHEHLANERAGGGDQAEEPDDVGQHAGRDEQGACEENNDAVHEFGAGQIARVQALIQSPPSVDAFSTGEVAARYSRCDDESDGGSEADELVDLNQQTQFDGRRKQKQQDKASKHERKEAARKQWGTGWKEPLPGV